MARESREWSVPAPVRALLWWPATSFVLVILAPDAAVSSIAAAGALLAVVGALLSAAARRLQLSAAENRSDAPTVAAVTTAELPTVEIPAVEEPAPRRVA